LGTPNNFKGLSNFNSLFFYLYKSFPTVFPTNFTKNTSELTTYRKACHAGGREFESRRSRHFKIKGLGEILNPLFICKISSSQHYSQQTPDNLKNYTLNICNKIISRNLFEWRLRLLIPNILYADKDSM